MRHEKPHPLRPAELDEIMRIWLAANLQAHGFIPADYWQSRLAEVRGLLPQAEVYVYGSAGFIGLDGEYIAGLFVAPERQGQGIGRDLLAYAESLRQRLYLHVYSRNENACRFYLREGFVCEGRQIEAATGEEELIMCRRAETQAGGLSDTKPY